MGKVIHTGTESSRGNISTRTSATTSFMVSENPLCDKIWHCRYVSVCSCGEGRNRLSWKKMNFGFRCSEISEHNCELRHFSVQLISCL